MKPFYGFFYFNCDELVHVTHNGCVIGYNIVPT
jgi:hypothetical protein